MNNHRSLTVFILLLPNPYRYPGKSTNVDHRHCSDSYVGLLTSTYSLLSQKGKNRPTVHSI